MEDSKLTTWGVKVTDEVREKIKNVMEVSGLQGKDFIESMVTLYEASLVKDSQPILGQELTELETITRRIINMYMGLGDRVKTILDDKERQQEQQQAEGKETIRLLHNKIRELEEHRSSLLEMQKEKVDSESGLVANINQLTELNESNKALIEEYRRKNDDLAGLIGEYRKYRDDFQAVKATAAAKDVDLMELQEQLRASAANTEKLMLEHGKQLLQLEKGYQEQLQAARDEYNQKVRELLQQMQQQPPQQEQQAGKKKVTDKRNKGSIKA